MFIVQHKTQSKLAWSNIVFLVLTCLTAKISAFELPKIQNKTPIRLIAETGNWTDYIKNQLVPDFTAQTGVKVEVVSAPLDDLYRLQTNALVNAKGQYDVLTIEAGWAKEWASNGYTFPILELKQQYNPSADNQEIEGTFFSALLEVLSYQGELHSLPYNSYIMGNHYRSDVFEHKDERQAFIDRFGYPLAPPRTLKQLKDTAAFFTRKKGETLMGVPLKENFYGVALMAGLRPHINDEVSSILWALDGKWLEPSYKDGELANFNIGHYTSHIKEALEFYRDLKQFAYPTGIESAFIQASSALNDGNAAMWPFAYNNSWTLSGRNQPGRKFGITQVPGQMPYFGAYAFAVAYDSDNPEASYWLLKYLTSFESQLEYAKNGGNPCRLDVIEQLMATLAKDSPQYQSLQASLKATRHWEKKVKGFGHFTSTAMGKIYPELMRLSYRVTAENKDPTQSIEWLYKQIYSLQNLHGEAAVVEYK